MARNQHQHRRSHHNQRDDVDWNIISIAQCIIWYCALPYLAFQFVTSYHETITTILLHCSYIVLLYFVMKIALRFLLKRVYDVLYYEPVGIMIAFLVWYYCIKEVNTVETPLTL